MHRNFARIISDGHPVHWLGANFWSRTGGPLMWRTYDPGIVSAELRALRDHGLDMTRSFFYWPDFMPEPDRIDEVMAGRFADFLDRHTEAGMSTVPTFIIGHMSGENWDPAWRGGRDLYGDVWMVARQAWFAGEMVRRFGRHPAVSGWLVSNEMPIYGGGAAREVIASWAQIIRDAVRAAGGAQPFSLGDGAWGTRGNGNDGGFSLADAARLCDFIGPHVYPVGDDEVRQHYAAAWECELAGTYGVPVVLEEFGVSSDLVSGASAARYYRQVLHNSLLGGATGWIGWCNSDFDALTSQDPYRHHAFELHFGLTDADGNPKPQLAEMRAFAEHPPRGRHRPLPARPRRRRAGRVVLPRHRLPVHSAGGVRLYPPDPAPGIRLSQARGPAGGAGQGERRLRRGCQALHRAVGQAAARPELAFP